MAGIGAFFEGLASGAQSGMTLSQRQQQLELQAQGQARADRLAELQEQTLKFQQKRAELQLTLFNLGAPLRSPESEQNLNAGAHVRIQ